MRFTAQEALACNYQPLDAMRKYILVHKTLLQTCLRNLLHPSYWERLQFCLSVVSYNFSNNDIMKHYCSQ
jgi:hypothetical protein